MAASDLVAWAEKNLSRRIVTIRDLSFEWRNRFAMTIMAHLDVNEEMNEEMEVTQNISLLDHTWNNVVQGSI